MVNDFLLAYGVSIVVFGGMWLFVGSFVTITRALLDEAFNYVIAVSTVRPIFAIVFWPWTLLVGIIKALLWSIWFVFSLFSGAYTRRTYS